MMIDASFTGDPSTLSMAERRNLGRNIAKFRKAKSLSQTDLGELVYGERSLATAQRISGLETGKNRPTRDVLDKILAALNGGGQPQSQAQESPDSPMTLGAAIDICVDTMELLCDEDRDIAMAATLRKLNMGPRLAPAAPRPIDITPVAPPSPRLAAAHRPQRPATPPKSEGDAKKAAVGRLAAAMEAKRIPADRAGSLPRTRLAGAIGANKHMIASALRGKPSVEKIEALTKRIEAI